MERYGAKEAANERSQRDGKRSGVPDGWARQGVVKQETSDQLI